MEVSAMHDDYKQLEAPAGVQIERCAVCGSAPQLWQYSTSPTAPTKKLVMCSHGDVIGPQSGLIHEGCLLYMPSDDFYRDTIRDAIRFWNEFAKALSSLRRANNWKHAQPLRIDDSGVAAVAPCRNEPVCKEAGECRYGCFHDGVAPTRGGEQ
jgi:hypothetical protein